jgi:hypothetical protein
VQHNDANFGIGTLAAIAGFTSAAHISAMFAPLPASGYNGAAAAARGSARRSGAVD